LKALYFPSLLFILGSVLLLPAATPASAPIPETELQAVAPKILRVGFSSRILSDIDPRDAQVAMELWTKELSRSMGIRTVPQTVIFKNTADLLAAVKKGELTIVSLPAVDYLKIRDEVRITPSVVSSSNAGKGRQFILLVRRDSGIRTVADLRGKTVLILPATKNEVSHLWLDVLMMREGNRDRSSFLRQVKEATSASQAIMALFFRQTDAAIVSRGAFETAMDLNPQIGSQLTVISESKSLLGDITCIPDSVNDKLKLSIEYAALHLHERAIGRQIFTLFKIDRTIPYQPSYLSGVSDLLKEHGRLRANSFKREQ